MIQRHSWSLQEDKSKDYYELLKQFTIYREQSIVEKEQMKKEIQKCKQQLDKFMSKIDKRVDSRIADEKHLHNHQLQEQEKYYKDEIDKLRILLIQKDKLIEEIRNVLRIVDSEKRQMIQNNTAILIQLSQGLDSNENKLNHSKDNSNKQLLKMYQFLIEENNELKKQIYLLKKSQINASAIGLKQQKSMLSSISELKPKSPTNHSAKNDQPTSFKNSSLRNQTTKQKSDKQKKTTKSRNNNR